MKHFTKITLIVVAVIGLAIGMSTVSGLSDNVSVNISSENSIMDSNCGSGKCGGDTKENTTDAKCGGDDAKASVKEAKCGEGKCGDGKCGGDNAAAKKSNFMDKDTNGDGKVSKIEFTDFSAKEFPNKDTNNDGKITSDECFMFDSFNTDGNDFLTKTEFQTGHDKMFSKMDTNNDGFIDANEAKSMHKSESGKCGEGKCGGGDAKAEISDKAGDAKCGEGKCG